MNFIGLDLTTSRLRAVTGPATLEPTPLALDGRSSELPLALSLEERSPGIGVAGSSLARCKPHLACLDFLPHLGTAREWTSPRHRLDASRALGLVFERLAKTLSKGQSVFAALPAYLSEGQNGLLGQLALNAGLPWLGSVASPLAVAQAAREQLPWSGVVLVVEVDGHALTFSAVAVSETTLQLLHSEPCSNLSLNVWQDRLIDGIAKHCIRRTRRDPRSSAEAEQGLYDQLPAALEAESRGEVSDFTVHIPQWYQQVLLQPGELAAIAAAQVRQCVVEMKRFAAAVANQGAIVSLLLTSTAARLPGLAAALNAHLHELPNPAASEGEGEVEVDFSDHLLLHDGFAAPQLHTLLPDAVARAAHQLAVRCQHGELTRSHHDSLTTPAIAPSLNADTGNARLQFRGQEFHLTENVFTVGREPGCDLVLESELYPTVSSRHCELSFDRRVYLLRDLSRHGTLVNDRRIDDQHVLRSGDWIRLGPGGPLLHFLGQPSGRRQLMPTA